MTSPSEEDIRVWCRLCHAEDQANDLIVTVRDIEAMYVEWRRRLRAGTRARQEKLISIEGETEFMRWHEPILIPGLLHTAEYATAVLQRVAAFYEVPNDVDAGVSARMEMQQILYSPHHRFHFVIGQQALRTVVGSRDVMIGQLDRLLSVMSMSRVRLGIIPAGAPYVVPSNQFIIFDERLVHIEAVTAEIAVTQPREVTMYLRSFAALAQLASYDADARTIIMAELSHLQAVKERLESS
ncbi:DNA-binding protein [Actinoplanes sp. ATCC 53533]|uniref:DUF5753 domain-containing protein n=1 Tax=Actinoplanes sp. ATCC 53533 TaxID=1288362 RepID=UPI000F795A3F|nr:DUF5753 domain-containing protein [Actinoplanes sp. ATCC 53533]RSM55059.1 DNA-binding protein [Actinoplanes sp. ATCC 53533]